MATYDDQEQLKQMRSAAGLSTETDSEKILSELFNDLRNMDISLNHVNGILSKSNESISDSANRVASGENDSLKEESTMNELRAVAGLPQKKGIDVSLPAVLDYVKSMSLTLNGIRDMVGKPDDMQLKAREAVEQKNRAAKKKQALHEFSAACGKETM